MGYVQVIISVYQLEVGMQCLVMTEVQPELISDADIYCKVMRGGISYISKRYSKVNNNYLKSYDPKQEPKHIVQLDANNYTVTRCPNFFQQPDLNGQTLINLT